jgi:hypothetical protein
MLIKKDSKLKIVPINLLIRCIWVAMLCMGTSLWGQVPDSSSTKVDNKGGLDEIIDYDAEDSLIYDLANNKVYLYGNAHLNYEDIKLHAGYIEIHLGTKYIVARGKYDSTGKYVQVPELKDGEDEYRSDSMEYNGALKKGRVYGLKLNEEGAIVLLNKVLKNDDGSFIGERGKITTCDADHPHFYFDANKIKVIPNDKVIFGPANLVIEDVPTPLAVPFGIAPIKKGRRNGILFPSYGYNQFNQSFYLQRLGYYRGLGPYADLTLSTDLYFSGDFRAGLTSKFVKKYKYSGSVGLNVSYFNISGLEKTSPLFGRSADFEIITDFRWDPKLHPGHSLGGGLNFKTAAFNRLNNRDILAANNNLVVSSFTYSTSFIKNKLSLTTGLNHNQNLQTREFNLTLPSVNVSMSSLQPFKGKNSNGTKWYEQIRVGYSGDVTNQISTYDSLLFSDNGLDEFKKLKTGARHSVPISANFKIFKGAVNLSPSFNYSENWYFKSMDLDYRMGDGGFDTTISSGFYRAGSYGGGLSATTNIYGTYQKIPVKGITAVRHTMTPTLSFNYNPKIDGVAKNWQGEYTDTLGVLRTYSKLLSPLGNAFGRNESGSLNFGLGNNLQAKKENIDSNGKKSYEKLVLINSFSMSTGYDFLADSLQLRDLSFALNTRLFKTVGIDGRGSWSFYKLQNGRMIQEFVANDDVRRPIRFVGANVTLNAELNPTLFGKKKTKVQYNSIYYQFDIPWSLGINMTTTFNPGRAISNNFNINGSLNLTEEWGIKFTTGYDLKTKQITPSKIDVTRDLHCWQISFGWNPNGFQRGWNFTLRPKSNLLQDLKIPKNGSSQPFRFGQ